jgi:hypothetical protein
MIGLMYIGVLTCQRKDEHMIRIHLCAYVFVHILLSQNANHTMSTSIALNNATIGSPLILGGSRTPNFSWQHDFEF